MTKTEQTFTNYKFGFSIKLIEQTYLGTRHMIFQFHQIVAQEDLQLLELLQSVFEI